jgi:hypothetical protein
LLLSHILIKVIPFSYFLASDLCSYVHSSLVCKLQASLLRNLPKRLAQLASCACKYLNMIFFMNLHGPLRWRAGASLWPPSMYAVEETALNSPCCNKINATVHLF